MSVELTFAFRCGGCSASEDVTKPLRQKFVSVSGRSWGLGTYQLEWPELPTPEGWVGFDLIGATYCPKCAEEIWPKDSEEVSNE